MENLAVAIVEPIYEVNLGHIARVMKNFGVNNLILINPKVGLNEAIKFASYGLNILKNAQVKSLDEVRKEYDLLIGTTAVSGKSHLNILRIVISPEELAERLKSYNGKACVLLGRDTTGLKNDELALCDMVVSINTGTDYNTLNIAHALAILLYEISKIKIGSVGREVASQQDRMRLIEYAIKLAESSGYPYHKLHLLRESLTRILGIAQPTPKEVYLIMGLLRKALLAIKSYRTHSTLLN
ncbi:MAG: TrmH family RNA methyltransferase [Nitrososphaerales archaeon]